MTESTTTEAYISARALAAELGVTSPTVRRWVRAGQLTPANITYGGYYEFDLQKAKAELESLRFIRNKATA